MDDYHTWTKILIFISYIFINFILFSFGQAVQSINTSDIEREMELGNKHAFKILRIVNRPGKFINTLQSIFIILSFAVGEYVLYSESLLEKIILYFLGAVITLSFGIIIPKRIGAKYAKNILYLFVNFISLCIFMLSPLTLLSNFISKIVLKIFGIDVSKKEDNVTEEDIMSMVNEGHEQGVLDIDEAEMITNIFGLDDKIASDVMTPRKNLVCIDADKTLEEVVDFMLSEGINSRYPVYEDDFDNVLGIINMKDALIYVRKKDYKKRTIKNIHGLIRKAKFIPETKSIDILFKEMQEEKNHLVIVIDEYGQTAGVLTLEDILEEIVGNIMDEYDKDEEIVVKIDENTFMVKGLSSLEEVNEYIGIEFEEDDYDNFETLSGFMISKLEKIPEVGEKFEFYYKGFLLIVEEVENKVINLVRIEKNKELVESDNINEHEREDT